MDVRVYVRFIETFREGPKATVGLPVAWRDLILLQRVYEPYLLQQGLIIRTPQR